MDDLDGLKLANGVVVAPNDCCHDNGCHMSDVTRDMDGGGSSVGEEEDTTGRKMSAVGKRHSKCPRRLGEEEIEAVGDVNKSKNKKKSTRTSVKENTSAKDVAMVTDEKENGENKSVDSTKKKGQAVTRKRKSNEQSARNENDAGDTPENPVVVVEELSSQNESVDNTKKKGQAVTRKRKSNEQSARNENDAGDTLENPVVVVEELSSIKPKRQRKAKPGSKGSEANSAEPCEPQLKGTKKRVKPKKQQGGMIVVEENATDGLAKVDPLDGVPAEGKDAPHGDTDSKDKTKVAAKSKAKKKKPPKNDGKLEKNSTNETQSITKVNKATDVVGRQPAKQKSRRKKAPAEESSKNPLSGSTSDIVSDLSRKDVSPAKKKKLDKCAKDNKSVVDTDSVSATNNTQDDVKVALDIKDASGVTDTSVVPCSDTEATGKALTNTNTTERSDQELKEQNSATCNNSSTRSSISPLETQSDRTESEPKAKESELKATASNEEDASRCFPCSHCKYRAKRKVQLRKHLGTHGVHQCAHCEFVCESSATLTEHMQSVHPDKYGRKKCKRCLRIIKMGDIEEHELACTGELRPWSCTQCGKEFKYECQLNLHARAHMSEDAAATAVKTHPCPHCDYSAYVKANLAKHLKTVHGTDRQKTVKCPECEKLFYTPSHMRKHLKLHSDEMPFACNVCAKAFRTARCLKRHTFVHMDSPAFICNIDGCKKAFEKHVLLKSHKLDCHQVADGASSSPPVKQFKCSYPDCEQAFYKKSHLARHEVIHTGERKFVCDWKDCGKAFRHSDNLRVHYRRHTNEKPIKCDKCDFTCRQKSSLQFHMKSRHELAGSAGTSPETKVGKDASPKKQNGDGAATDGESELKSDTPEMLVGASVTTGLAGGGIIRAAEMAPLAKTEAQPTPTKVSHDVYDFHDSDDDDDMNHSIGLQMRQKTVGKSPPCGSLLNNSSFVSIRDEAQHRYVTNVAASDEKVALAKDTDIETAVKPNTAGKATKKTQARPTPDGDKSSIVQNDTPQTKAPSRKRKKKEASSVEKKCEDVGSENPAAEKAVVTAVTSPVTITTPRGLPTATTMKTTKKKAATKRSRKKKPPIEEETTTEQASDAVEQPSMPENTNDSLKEVSQDVDDGHTTTDDGHTTTNDGHTTTDDGHTTTDVDNVDTRTCDAGAVHVRVEDPSGDVVAQQVCPPDAVNEWPSSESRTTVTNDSTGQLYEHEYRPEDPQQEQNIDPIDEQTEDMTEEEANELLPSPATVSQLMSEKDVNELSMPSMANGSPNLSVHSDFVNNVAMSPRTYNESPQFSGKCDEYEQEKELEAATAEAESAMFGVEMPAITSQDQTKINDILDSQAELMPPSSENMIDTADNHSPFMMPGSTGNAYNNTTDSRDTYSSSVANLSYPVDAMSADKKADENADISQCYSGANASYGGYPSLSSVQERQSVLKSNPAASVSCNYSPPPPPPQPSYQPLPSHSLYGGRSASVLPPVGSYSHVPNPSFLLDPNLLTNGGSTKGLESLRNSEPAYVISRDGPQLPVSSASSASNKALPISSCFPGSEGYASSTKDFFGQYFQDPTTMPLTHLPTSADQRLYHRAPHRAGFDFLPRVPGTASVLPGATTYPASVSESLAAAMNPAMNPQHAQSHWGVAHDDRSHPWAQPSPMLMAPDLNAARNPFSASSTADRSTDLNFDPSAASRQLTKRAVPESTFPIPQPNTVGADPYSSMTNAYIGRAFNPAAAVAPSNYMMNMSSSMSSTQKQLEEAYRQSAVAAAAHIADYRSLAPQAAVPDIYSRMGVNPTLGLDKYYYSRREQMYRSQAIAATPNPFLAPPPSQTNSTPVSYASDYSCAQVMYAAAAQHSAAAYGFMGDKQYLMSSRKISEAVPMLPERPPDYFPARPSTTEAQDPYRHSVIYNMMSRYY